jgi:hypothetical protein
MAVKVIGLDTAKHVFQAHGADEIGRTVLRKRGSEEPRCRILPSRLPSSTKAPVRSSSPPGSDRTLMLRGKPGRKARGL